MPQDQVPDQDIDVVQDQELELDHQSLAQDQDKDQELDQDLEIVPDADIGTAVFRIRFIDYSKTQTKTWRKT